VQAVTLEVNESEIVGLVAGGYLPEEARGNHVAIKAAIEVVISDSGVRARAREVQRERISLLRCSEERVTERRKN
jgi:hypothetical protein